jgi:hypothetical protein
MTFIHSEISVFRFSISGIFLAWLRSTSVRLVAVELIWFESAAGAGLQASTPEIQDTRLKAGTKRLIREKRGRVAPTQSASETANNWRGLGKQRSRMQEAKTQATVEASAPMT